MKNDTATVQSIPNLKQSDFPLDCESPAFRQFSLKMDRQVRKLVAHWSHLAAPNALRAQRRLSDSKIAPK
jgi:hypothetical protein